MGQNGFDSIAYKRTRDFYRAVKSNPTLIIAPASFNNKAYKKIAQFTSNGKSQFQYSIMKLKNSDRKPFKSAAVGYIEEMGRKESKDYIRSLFGGRSFRAYKPVSNSQDLLALLSLGNVDYVIVSPQALIKARREFSVELDTVQKSVRTKFPQVFASRKAKIDMKKVISKLTSVSEFLGFDQVSPLGGR